MSDEELRALERAYRAGGGVEAEARWLAARLRAGELTEQRLRAAAWAGHAAAAQVVGPVEPPPLTPQEVAVLAEPGLDAPIDPAAPDTRAWLVGLGRFGAPVVVDALAALVGAVWSGFELEEAADRRSPTAAGARALAAARAWAARPSAPAAGDALLAARPLEAFAREPRAGEAGHLALAIAAVARGANEAERLALVTDDVLRHLGDVGVETETAALEVRRALRTLDPAAAPPPPLPTTRRLEALLRLQLAAPTGWLRTVLFGRAADAHDVHFWLAPAWSGWLERHRVLEVGVGGPLFERAMLPAGGTIGHVLTDGRSLLLPLDRHHPEHLERLLAAEPGFAAADPADLAGLLIAARLDEGNVAHQLLESADELLVWSGPGQGYLLDRRAWEGYREKIAPPRLSAGGDGLRLGFTTISGWMHETQVVTRFDARLDAAGRVTLLRDVLCERAFLETPGIVY